MAAGQKSLFVTYFLWFFFGWLGLHHFYLRRDRQAFLWWSTLGGIFYLGWIRDLWRIPEYVDDANEEKYYMESLLRKRKLRKSPQFSTTRFAGEMAVGYIYGILVRLAIPEEVSELFHGIMVPVGIAAGVHIVGNIGREKGPFMQTYLAAIGTWYVLRVLGGADVNSMYCSLIASCVFNKYREFDYSTDERTLTTRIVTLCKGAAVIWILWLCFLYFNAYVTVENGEKVRLRDTVNHFFKSPAWLNFKATLWQVYEQGRIRGWRHMYDHFVQAMDPTGESNAYKVLAVEKTASEEEIRRAYKKLVIIWHPDRYKGDDRKGAEQKFMEIQQAYEILTSRRKSSKQRSEKVRTEF